MEYNTVFSSKEGLALGMDTSTPLKTPQLFSDGNPDFIVHILSGIMQDKTANAESLHKSKSFARLLVESLCELRDKGRTPIHSISLLDNTSLPNLMVLACNPALDSSSRDRIHKFLETLDRQTYLEDFEAIVGPVRDAVVYM